MSRPIRFVATLALLLGAAPAARAQTAAEPAAGTPSALVVSAENRSAAADAARGARRADAAVRPGDVLRYQLLFTNVAGRQIRGVVLMNPVPAGLRYVPGSTTASRPDARAEFSADSGRTFSSRPMESVTVDGKKVVRPVPAERYTHVRWTVAGWVQPQATVTAAFEARVGDVATRSDSATTKPSATPAAGQRGR